jgi:hypothetical protein
MRLKKDLLSQSNLSNIMISDLDKKGKCPASLSATNMIAAVSWH